MMKASNPKATAAIVAPTGLRKGKPEARIAPAGGVDKQLSQTSAVDLFFRQMREPRVIALLGAAGALGIGASARLGFGASLLESVFWSASFLGLGLGAASYARLSTELSRMRNSLDHTRKHMATTARVLSETIEQAESLALISREPTRAAVPAVAASSTDHQVNLEGLANVARAQVILANKSEADISVLSTLVSDLAEAVAEQEREIKTLREHATAASSETAEARTEAREAAKLVRRLLDQGRPSFPALRQDDAKESSRTVLNGRFAEQRVEPADHDEAADPVLVKRLGDAFANGGFGFALQPVVTLPQRKVKFYELSLVISADSGPIEAQIMRKAAKDAGVGAQYDRTLIARALRLITYFRSKQKDITVICEVTGSLLVANPAFDELIAELRRDKDAARSLVIGFPHAVYRSLRQGERDLLRFFSEAGTKFGVMGLTDMRLDPAALSAANVSVATIDVMRMIEAIPTGLPGLDVHVGDIAGLFARRNIDLVVQNVKDEQQLLDIIDLDTPLAQGRLLGEPRPINPELVTPPQGAEPVPAPPAPANTDRQPLRNFLRRA